MLVSEPRFGSMSVNELVYNQKLFPHISFKYLQIREKTERELEEDYLSLIYNNPFLMTHRMEIVTEHKDLLPYYDSTNCRQCDIRKKLKVIREELIARNAEIGWMKDDPTEQSVEEEKPKPKRKPRKTPAKKPKAKA